MIVQKEKHIYLDCKEAVLCLACDKKVKLHNLHCV